MSCFLHISHFSSSFKRAKRTLFRIPDPSYPHLTIVKPPKGESRRGKWKKWPVSWKSDPGLGKSDALPEKLEKLKKSWKSGSERSEKWEKWPISDFRRRFPRKVTRCPERWNRRPEKSKSDPEKWKSDPLGRFIKVGNLSPQVYIFINPRLRNSFIEKYNQRKGELM